MSREECRYCKAKCQWATFLASGRRALVDPLPVENGNIALTRQAGLLTAQVVAEIDRPNHDELFVLHFATCPHANTARRPRPRKKGKNGVDR